MPTINEILLSNPRILYTGNQNFTNERTVVGVFMQLTGVHPPQKLGNLNINAEEK